MPFSPRPSGISESSTAALLSISNDRKRAILAEHGIDFESTPQWQRWGVGVYNVQVERKGFNPKTGKEETGIGNALKVDRELPLRNDYVAFVKSLLQPSIDREEHRKRWAASSKKKE